MATQRSLRTGGASVWGLARPQHGVVSRRQLLDAGLTPEAIRHRVRRGKLHPVRRGVFAVGRPGVDQLGRWMAAVLACGSGAVLSHTSAGALWGISTAVRGLHVTVPPNSHR